LGKNATELLCPEAVSQIKELMKILVEQGEWQGELHQLTKSGRKSSQPLDTGASPGKTKINPVVNTDITQKKQLEAQFFAPNVWRALPC